MGVLDDKETQKIMVNHRFLDHSPMQHANASKSVPVGKSVFVWLQKKILLSRAPKFHFRVHTNPFLHSIVSQMNSVRRFTRHITKDMHYMEGI